MHKFNAPIRVRDLSVQIEGIDPSTKMDIKYSNDTQTLCHCHVSNTSETVYFHYKPVQNVITENPPSNVCAIHYGS